MKAVLQGHVIAESDDIVESSGYHYFPAAATRREWLEKAPKTESDRACPHGVQFYDLVIDGVRHGRAAWSYEAPRPALQHVAGRFGFWNEVQVG
jgi:uncharacterized protein (DUF427 family)